jgi:Putative antitoxin of bacterial toxin-antitoxin system, YdaS/YdaT
MTEPAVHPLLPWDKATPPQLLTLIVKVLGVAQQTLARQLGVSPKSVSFWVTGYRPIPAKYRPALVEWAQVAWQQADERNTKRAQAQPTADLQRAAVLAFWAPLQHWTLDVLHEAGVLEATLKKNLRWLRAYADHDTFTTRDLRTIATLAKVIRHEAELVASMTPPDDPGTPPTQDGEP